MKKFYLILSLFILSLSYATNVTAQSCPIPGDPPNIYAFLKGSDYPGSTNCYIEVYTTEEWIGAVVEAYVGETLVTYGPTTWTTYAGSHPGYGRISFQCNTLFTVTEVELKLNNNTCSAPIQQRALLPIKLSAFNATLKSGGVVLNWTSEVESVSSHIGIEKSGDGKNFTTIGTVKAAGFSNSPLKYSYTDNNFSGTAFYRLKLVDLDGKSEYSKVIYANGGSGASTTLSVFPNPFRSDVQLKGINASDVNKNNIRVFNVAGKEVSYQVTGANSIAIDANLPKGVYILQVKDLRYKLVKE